MQIYPSKAMADAPGAPSNALHEAHPRPAAAADSVSKLALCGLERPGWIHGLLQYPALQSLDLRQYGITPQTDLSGLSRLKNLRRIGLPFQTTDQHLSQLRQTVGLESVCLERCVEITPAGIAHLAGLPRLYALRLPTGMPDHETRQLQEVFFLLPPDSMGFRRCLGIKLIRGGETAPHGPHPRPSSTPIRSGYSWEALPCNGLHPAITDLRRPGRD